VTDADGRVLIAQRPPGKKLAGSWEFPGGKLEAGEERVAGLARELREELGIDVIGQPRPLLRVRHAYPFGEVLIDMWVVHRYAGAPRGLDGQQLRWCRQDELAAAQLLPADRPIVAALRLPERLREASSADYIVRSAAIGSGAASVGSSVASPRFDGRLRGVFCSSAEDGIAAAGEDIQGRGGAARHTDDFPDFLVMQGVIADAELAALCASVPVPVYAQGDCLERVWALGASGINDLESTRS
jgi:mutator protein MutT